MDQTKTQEHGNQCNSDTNLQFRVRTNLRGGESVDACMNNLQYWQDEYYRWYEQAKYKNV